MPQKIVPIELDIDVGTGGHWGHLAPQDFAMNKEVPFSFLENAPFFLRKTVPSKRRASKFEMLPTSLGWQQT